MYKNQVRDLFYKYVDELKIDPDLRDALRATRNPKIKTAQSVNIDRFIENLTRELQAAHAYKIKKSGRPFTSKSVNGTIKDMVELFCFALQKKAQKMHESDLAKTVRERERQAIKDMDDTLNGNPSGAFEEMGVAVDESRDETQ